MAPQVDWQEELHPRDTTGKFSSGGGNGGRSKSPAIGIARRLEQERKATDVEQLARLRQLGEGRFEKQFPKGKTTEEQKKSLSRLREARSAALSEEQQRDCEGRVRIPESRHWIAHDPTLPEQTWKAHWRTEDGSEPEGVKSGKPSPERVEKVHKPCIEKFFKDAKKTPEGAQKVAVLTMGAPASGKSSAVGDAVSSDWVRIDPDAIKDELPEYGIALKANARDAALMAHEESSYLGKQMREKAISEGYPVMIDGTGRNPESMSGLIDKLHANGYKVHLVMADLDEETGMARMVKRAEATGRYVPPDFVQDSYRNIPGNFEELSKLSDSFTLVDTRGSSAKVAWSRTAEGVETVHDEDRVAEFKARAHAQRWARKK